jgi:hypothetical protein
MFVRARRALSAGEELTFSYLDPLLPLDKRRHIIKRDHGFVCHCELCTDQEEFEDKEPRKAAVSYCQTTWFLMNLHPATQS